MKIKLLALATTTLAASLGAYAAVPTDAQPFQVVVPNLKSGVEVTLEGLLLRPSNSDLDYTTNSTPTIALTGGDLPVEITNNQTVSQVNPKYNFGFRVGLGYVFPDSGNDVQLNWTHFSKSSDDSVTAAPGSFLVTDLDVPLPSLSSPVVGPNDTVSNAFNPTASSSVDFKYDAVDLDAGQYLDIGTRLRVRMFGGLRFARVESDRTDTYSAAYNYVSNETGDFVAQASYDETDNLDSKFNGVGPRMGFDTSYHIANCFGIVGHFAGALLVGSVDTTTNSNVVLGFNPDPGVLADINVNTSSNDNVTRVVPAFDAKLGLDYTYIFDNQSTLSLEIGYQWTQYIDAVDRLNESAVPGVVTRTTSSVGFDGPYLTLNWKV